MRNSVSFSFPPPPPLVVTIDDFRWPTSGPLGPSFVPPDRTLRKVAIAVASLKGTTAARRAQRHRVSL